jgi:hypothetical protein
LFPALSENPLNIATTIDREKRLEVALSTTLCHIILRIAPSIWEKTSKANLVATLGNIFGSPQRPSTKISL